MPRAQKTEADVLLKFGGGIHSSASDDEIDLRECTDGQNFILDASNREFKNRKPFDRVGTVPNNSEIRGFASLLKTDGSVSMLVQAGTVVYEWDGVATFTSVGTVATNTQMRGKIGHNWPLDDKVIITDINLQEVVKEWDGTTFQTMTENLTGDFKAKYCVVRGERAFFGNIISNSVETPHVVLGSKISDEGNLTTANRPSSGLGTGDAFFLHTLDLKPINGLEDAFGFLTISSEKGDMVKLSGSDSTDFNLTSLYPQSGASGNEAISFIGNDIAYGRSGRIESLRGAETFGDVENDDLSRWITPDIETYDAWCLIYNRRLQRLYCFPDGQSEVWVFFKPVRDNNLENEQNALSPWSKWVTTHSLAFQPTAVMNAYDPSDKLEYVFMGDSSGNLYRMEGSGTGGDGGQTNIETKRTSKLFAMPSDAEAYNIEGYIKHRRQEEVDLDLTMLYSGYEPRDLELSDITLKGPGARPAYNNSLYYNNSSHYGIPFEGRLVRRKLEPAGAAEDLQIKLAIDDTDDFAINEIGLQFDVAIS